MSTIQEQLFALLSPLTAGRMYPTNAVENVALPYLVYERQPGPVENVLDGNGNPPAENTIFQVNCWGRSYADACALADGVTAAMLGWSVQNTKHTSDHDIYENDVKLHRVVQEYSVWVSA